MQYEPVEVLENRELTPGHWLLRFRVEGDFPDIKPGQFLNLRCDPGDVHSLMRPFSILDADALEHTISVFYKHLGRLSTRLSDIRPGTMLECLYPLGGGFPWKDDWRRVALVGGGVGLAPMLYLGQYLEPTGPTMHVVGFFGGNTEKDLVEPLLKDYRFPMELATMDGSVGFKGNAVELFSRSDEYFDVIYTCGPNPMMQALAKVLPPAVPAYASLEEYMACGVGACYGCAVKIRENDTENYRTVCKDGPVFDLRQVVFE